MGGVQVWNGERSSSGTVGQPLLSELIIDLHESGTRAGAVVVPLIKYRLDGVCRGFVDVVPFVGGVGARKGESISIALRSVDDLVLVV
jgi:hypothetical protein